MTDEPIATAETRPGDRLLGVPWLGRVVLAVGTVLLILSALWLLSPGINQLAGKVVAALGLAMPGRAADVKAFGYALNLVAVAIVVTVLFGFALPRAARLESEAGDRILTWSGIAVLVVLWLPHVLIAHSGRILGTIHWWLGDDAMISMRYARNAARGFGLVWNAGERVEGYTNFLWTGFMALLHLLPIPVSRISLVVLLVNLAIAATLIPLAIRLVRLLDGGTLAAGFAVAALVLNRSVKAWTTEGFESTLLAVVVLLAVVRILRESREAPTQLATFFIIALIPLIRADGAVLAGLLYLFALLCIRDRRRVIVYSAISLLLPAAHLIFRLAYYGELLPNTAYLKVSRWDERTTAGLEYVLGFARANVVPLVVATLAAVVVRRRDFISLLLLVGVYAGYIAYIGGDAGFTSFRFFVPVVPLLLVLACRGAEVVAHRFPPAVLVLATACIVFTPALVPGFDRDFVPGEYGYGNSVIGVLLSQTPPATRVADFWAGSTFYFSDRYGIDLLGKNDARIARMEVATKRGLAGHNKYDLGYSIGELKPDFVVAGFRLPVDSGGAAATLTGPQPYLGALYFEPSFREHCFASPVLPGTVRTVFRCTWP